MDELYTVKEVSEILRLNTKTIKRYIDEKKLTAVWLGNRWRIKPKDLEAFIDERTQP